MIMSPPMANTNLFKNLAIVGNTLRASYFVRQVNGNMYFIPLDTKNFKTDIESGVSIGANVYMFSRLQQHDEIHSAWQADMCEASVKLQCCNVVFLEHTRRSAASSCLRWKTI